MKKKFAHTQEKATDKKKAYKKHTENWKGCYSSAQWSLLNNYTTSHAEEGAKLSKKHKNTEEKRYGGED